MKVVRGPSAIINGTLLVAGGVYLTSTAPQGIISTILGAVSVVPGLCLVVWGLMTRG